MSNYANSFLLKKTGSICFKCSQKFEFEVSYKPSLCKSCERDFSVNRILSPTKSILNKIERFSFNKNFERVQTVILYLSIGFIILSIVLSIFQIDFSTILTNILLSIYWVLSIFRLKSVMSGNKKSPQNEGI